MLKDDQIVPKINQLSVGLYGTLNMFTFVQFTQRLFIYFRMVRIFCERVSVCVWTNVYMEFSYQTRKNTDIYSAELVNRTERNSNEKYGKPIESKLFEQIFRDANIYTYKLDTRK